MNTLKDFVNWKLTHADKVAEAEGYPLVLENCKKNKRMKQLEVYGNSVQDGTPTPENPIEVQSVGEKSVNLTDGILEVGGIANATGQNSNSTGYFRSVNYTLIIPNTVYTITASKPIQFVYFYDKDYNFINLSVENARTFTTPENCEYIRYRIIRNESIENETVDKAMLVLGSTVTTYEPYGKYKIPVVARGVNLINVNDFKNGNFTINEDGSCTLGWFLNGRFSEYNTNLSHIPAGSKLVFITSILEATTNTKNVLVQLIYSNGSIKYYGLNGTTKITLEDTIKQVGLYIHNSEEKGSYITFKDFGLYYENEYMGYEPYVEPITTNVYLNEPLQKIGDYADYIDFKNKKVVRNNYKQLINSSIGTNWSRGTDAWQRDGHFDVVVTSFYKYVPIREKYGYSNRFMRGNWVWGANKFPNNYFYVWDTKNAHLIMQLDYLDGITEESTLEETISAIKNYLDNNETYVIYPLATPIEESIICTLPKLKAKTTIIEVDTSLAPSDAYGKYIKK